MKASALPAQFMVERNSRRVKGRDWTEACSEAKLEEYLETGEEGGVSR